MNNVVVWVVTGYLFRVSVPECVPCLFTHCLSGKGVRLFLLFGPCALYPFGFVRHDPVGPLPSLSFTTEVTPRTDGAST